jgi:hypothetical protein
MDCCSSRSSSSDHESENSSELHGLDHPDAGTAESRCYTPVINPQAPAAASIQVLHLINTNCRQQTAAEYIYIHIYISMFLSLCDDLDSGSRIDPMSAPAAAAPY